MVNRIKIDKKEDYLKVSFFGEIDSLSVLNYRNLLIDEINDCYKAVIFDFNDVSFIDSSGIGLVLGRYNQVKANHGTMYLMNLNIVAYRLFELTGIFSLMEYIESEEEIYTKVGKKDDSNGD